MEGGGGGGENCNGCRSWEEDIYWTHFQFLHFAQFLRSGFDQHLALPKTFSDNIKKKLPENVTLKGPGGVVWNIGLTTRDDTLYFTQGWQQFVKDHSLKENDFLVFKYNGESLFEVLIFDGESFREKAASYFVRKCGHANAEQHGGGCSSKRRRRLILLKKSILLLMVVLTLLALSNSRPIQSLRLSLQLFSPQLPVKGPTSLFISGEEDHQKLLNLVRGNLFG